MEPSSRNRISVDLHGLKALLMERAQALGVSPSELVRKALADELDRSAGNMNEPSEKRTGGRSERACAPLPAHGERRVRCHVGGGKAGWT